MTRIKIKKRVGEKSTCLSVCGGADVFCPGFVRYMLSAQGRSKAVTAARHTCASLGMKPPAELNTTVPLVSFIATVTSSNLSLAS